MKGVQCSESPDGRYARYPPGSLPTWISVSVREPSELALISTPVIPTSGQGPACASKSARLPHSNWRSGQPQWVWALHSSFSSGYIPRKLLLESAITMLICCDDEHSKSQSFVFYSVVVKKIRMWAVASFAHSDWLKQTTTGARAGKEANRKAENWSGVRLGWFSWFRWNWNQLTNCLLQTCGLPTARSFGTVPGGSSRVYVSVSRSVWSWLGTVEYLLGADNGERERGEGGYFPLSPFRFCFLYEPLLYLRPFTCAYQHLCVLKPRNNIQERKKKRYYLVRWAKLHWSFSENLW